MTKPSKGINTGLGHASVEADHVVKRRGRPSKADVLARRGRLSLIHI